ncbi:hypothetical protein B0T14DRAFT_490106 [Immersiella caudata]|uniref:Uncharacterized protein n=1 Tax=Immersiella caudata TaxID=314043 RepID=A0AA40CAZ3_9PEZI|nr:hypothetical protein B0T14DRAFT_490106 [Immersiella caudata]
MVLNVSGRAPDEDYDLLFDCLHSQGFEWKQIDSPAAPERRGLDGGMDDDVTVHFVLRGLQQQNSTLGPADVSFTTYANGTGTVQSHHHLQQPLTPTPGNGATNNMQRRHHDGEGFKVNWSVVEYHHDALSQRDASHVISWTAKQLSTAVGHHWAWLAYLPV